MNREATAHARRRDALRLARWVLVGLLSLVVLAWLLGWLRGPAG